MEFLVFLSLLIGAWDKEKIKGKNMTNIKIQEILRKEKHRQDNTVELIASENFASNAVMELSGSILTNKYAEGYPGKRYYNGCDNCDDGASVNTSGAWFDAHTYGVDKDGMLDYADIMEQAIKVKPKMIIAGASAYPRQINWNEFRKIANEVDAMLMVDMAHYSGLIAGSGYDSPIGIADVVTSTTHKTLRGPRGGIILWDNPNYTRKINSGIFPGTQGGPLMHIIAAKAQCFIEANTPEFKQYTADVIKNAKAMCQVFEINGFPVQTSGTDSHIILMDLSNKSISGRKAADLLEENGITVNKNGVPNDPRPFMETSGIRIGTAAETTRGHDTQWFVELAKRIVTILNEETI